MEEYIVRWMGFPVVIEDPVFRRVLGEDVLDADPSFIEKKVCEALVFGASRLTGVQVRFLRHHMLMTQAELARALVQANHSIVSVWEGNGNETTGMNPATEMLMRLLVAQKVLGDAAMLRAMGTLPRATVENDRTTIRIKLAGRPHQIALDASCTIRVAPGPGKAFPDWMCQQDSELGLGHPVMTCRKAPPPAGSWNLNERGGDDVSFAA